jgi:hypothetical protein
MDGSCQVLGASLIAKTLEFFFPFFVSLHILERLHFKVKQGESFDIVYVQGSLGRQPLFSKENPHDWAFHFSSCPCFRQLCKDF